MAQALTDGSWLPLAYVQQHLGVEDDTPQVADAERVRRAAAARVERLRPDLFRDPTSYAVAAPQPADVDPDVTEAALLVAARLHSRKGSPAGLASYGEFGPAAVLRLDPDVERLLQVGRYARPVVG